MFTLETGTVTLTDTIDGGHDQTISFTNSFDKLPAVVTYIPTRGGGDSIQVRAKNVTTSGFGIHMEEPDDEGHSSEDAVWLAVERGEWNIDGVKIEADIHSTSTTRDSSNGSSFGDTISFDTSWSSAPSVLHNLQSYENGAWAATQANSVDTTNFNLSQEIAQVSVKTQEEVIGWVAFEDVGSGSIDGNTIDTTFANDGTGDGVDDTPHEFTFNASFSSTPDIVVSGQTMNGTDGYWSRGAGVQWDTNGHDVYAEEDQTSDTERGHADETFGYFAIDPNATINEPEKIATVKQETGSGTISVPVIETGTSDSDVLEVYRMSTGSQVGYIPLTTKTGEFNQWRVQSANNGVLQAHNDIYAEALVDSFEDGDISEYTQTGGNWSVVDESNVTPGAKDGTKLLQGDPGSDTGNELIHTTSGLLNFPSTGDTFRCWCRTGDDSSEDDEQGPFIYFAVSGDPRSGGRGYRVGLSNSGSQLDDAKIVRHDTDGTSTTLASSTSGSYTLSTWYLYEVTWKGDGTIDFTIYNDELVEKDNVTATDSTFTDGGIAYEHGSGSATSGFSTVYFDHYRIL